MIGMGLYSLLLLGVFVVGAPYWLVRLLGSDRYRAGLAARLGGVPAALREAVAGKQVVWVHAVSVGEVLAAQRLVVELEAALRSEFGEGWVIAISTTTATGQALARERFGAGLAGEGSGRVFWYPLDFAWAVRGYLRVLNPRLVVLMESELWPRMLVECGRMGVPVAVVNARVSDRSYARGVKVKAVWGRVLRRVDLFLAQSEEDGRRLVEMGARSEAVRVVGNLKYDVRAAKESRVAEQVRKWADGRSVIVAGSTCGLDSEGLETQEEQIVADAWDKGLRARKDSILVLAPRHPERFGYGEMVAAGYIYRNASGLSGDEGYSESVETVLLDTIGDLAAVYGVADVAFVGGSLVQKGGHNPLEPAQFGVPVVMGPSFENFRDVVGKMQAADGIRIVNDGDELEMALVELLTDREKARAMGERGRRVFEEQQGATGRAVEALVGLVRR
jgi:3-deoxy-D-manno-octulosonic-acid transferase